LLALVIPSVLLIYVRGQTLASFPLTYLIQVFGGRFWANAMLAAAALVAYDAANAPGALRIASLDTDERARHGPATETGSGLRAAA
jgi:hypothetical protein